jgi:hypothetical protein
VNFLQPLALFALPLIALPILIHLINQQRHRTLPWGAMMFLMSAKRMSKGMAQLRHLLIMLMRMLAIGALVFVVSRPLAGGWLGGVGLGKLDATLILLDRSASMEMADLQAGESKRSTALKLVAQLLEQNGYGTHLILIDSTNGQAHEVASPKALLNLPITEATATSTDIPGMFESALAYLKANNSGRADVWICSDLNEHDWQPDSGRWGAIREEFTQLEGTHHFLLSYADRSSSNLSVRVENVRRWKSSNSAELLLDVTVQVEGRSGVAQRVPIEFEVNNIRSVVELEMDTWGASLQGHRIPIDARLSSGWGSVQLPGDVNPLDNRYFFVFSKPPVRRAIIVSDDTRTSETFRRALAIPTETGLQHHINVIPVARVGEIDWESTGLLIWQAPLPQGHIAEQIENFINTGRVVLFFPPVQSSGSYRPVEDSDLSEHVFGSRWGGWQIPEQDQAKITWWRGDADLFVNADSGDALPLNELRTYQYCNLETPGTTLARYGDDNPMLTRLPTDRGGVYFCSTLPTAQFSSLERDGVVFYVMLQRALTEGCRSLATTSQRDAGPSVLADRDQWEAVAPAADAPTLSQRGLHAGVYRDVEYWAAVNRSRAEDSTKVTPIATVDELFDGLSYRRIDVAVGDTSALASEIWRAFLVAMGLALIVEALLSLPSKRVEQGSLDNFAVTSGSRN